MGKISIRMWSALVTTQGGRYVAVCDGRTRNALIRRGMLTHDGHLTADGLTELIQNTGGYPQ